MDNPRIMNLRAITLVAFGLLTAAAAQAQQFYRCTDSAGKVTLSDKVCDSGAADASRFVLKPNTLDSSEGRAQDLRQVNEPLQNRQQDAAQGQQFGRTAADLQAERSNSYECRRATKDFETTSSSVTSGGRGNQAAEQAMRVACGMREPSQVNVYNGGSGGARRRFAAAGGYYTPAAGGYISPRGEFCPDAIGGVACANGFVPVR